MIAWNDLQQIAITQKVSPFVILREYIQILFLNNFYSLAYTENTVFKGGTCIRLIHGSNRFSEDLDFTTNLEDSKISRLVQDTVDLLKKSTAPISIKTVRTTSGFTQKLSMTTNHSVTPLSIKLDFSQRENVLQKNRGLISSALPSASFSPIIYMEKEEILAEKCRAIMSRHKGRDIYDLWYLLMRKTPINFELIQKKLDYYHETFDLKELIKNINAWKYEDFDHDVRGFLPEPDRKVLPHVIPGLVKWLNE